MQESKIQHWLVKHDKSSVENRPGWIWRTMDSTARLPPNYRQINVGDKFVLYAHESSDDEDSESCNEVYGFYEVVSSLKYNQDKGCYEIKGRKISKEGWVRIPNPQKFYQTKKFNQQSVINLEPDEFNKFFNEHEKFLGATWGIFNREPKNEQETIALFSSVMAKIGYKLFKKLGTRTPDAEIIHRDGSCHRVEFEYKSSGLKSHHLEKHLKGVYCICWIDDLPIGDKYRENRKIITLRDELKPHKA